MYCPNCAGTIDGAKFCRSCGSNVSLVPHAMSGQLAQAEISEGPGRQKRRREPSIEHAVSHLFTGIGFIIAAILVLTYFPGGFVWWWGLFIPAFTTIGKGIGQYLQFKEKQRKEIWIERPAMQPQIYSAAQETSAFAKQPNVSEHTTRHLE